MVDTSMVGLERDGDADAGMGRFERGEPLPAGTKLRRRATASKNRRQSRGGRDITDSGAGNGGVGSR